MISYKCTARVTPKLFPKALPYGFKSTEAKIHTLTQSLTGGQDPINGLNDWMNLEKSTAFDGDVSHGSLCKFN